MPNDSAISPANKTELLPFLDSEDQGRGVVIGTRESHVERTTFGGWKDTASSRELHREGAGGINFLTLFSVSHQDFSLAMTNEFRGQGSPLYSKQVSFP